MLTVRARGVVYTWSREAGTDRTVVTSTRISISHNSFLNGDIAEMMWLLAFFGKRGQSLEWPRFVFWVGANRLRPSCYGVLSCAFSAVFLTPNFLLLLTIYFFLGNIIFLTFGPPLTYMFDVYVQKKCCSKPSVDKELEIIRTWPGGGPTNKNPRLSWSYYLHIKPFLQPIDTSSTTPSVRPDSPSQRKREQETKNTNKNGEFINVGKSIANVPGTRAQQTHPPRTTRNTKK